MSEINKITQYAPGNCKILHIVYFIKKKNTVISRCCRQLNFILITTNGKFSHAVVKPVVLIHIMHNYSGACKGHKIIVGFSIY